MSTLGEPTRVAALYNPHNQSKQQLIDGFVARQNTFKNLFKAIKDAKMEVPEQHYLLLGRRGMGKTTLLLRLAYEVENDPALNTWLVPLVFNEEEYSVRRLFKFWERIMDLLEEKLPELRFEPAERQRLSQQHKDDNAYERALFDWLAAELTRTGRKLLLFIDNFGDMARKLTDGEAHRLRKILQTSADIRIIAASAVVLEAFYDYAHPFYEFFKVQELRGLNPTETRDLLLKLSEHYKKETVARIVQEHPGRVEALRRITGGVIRTIILLFEIFSDDEDGSAFKELEVVLDRATPLYKHRMDDLSDQQQTIVEAIALNWDGLSVKEIAEQTRLESKIISAQLHNLEKNGIIEKRATKTKNHLYLIAERFFNIWYLMRNGRRSDEKRVRWLVHFFEEWYDDDMLKRRAKQHRQALQRGDFHPEAALAYTQVFVQSPKFSAIDKHELLDTTRIFLSEKAPDLAQDLLASDLDEAYRAINLWVQGEKKKSIALLSPVYGQLFPNEKDSTKTAVFWEQEMVKIINKTGLLFYGLSEPNLTKAEQCWRWAAEQGNIDAMFNIGWLFQTKPNNLEKAIEWYLVAAKKGNGDAMFNLGWLFQTKQNDLKKAMEWYLMAARKGNVLAMNNIGWILQYKENSLDEAIEWYLKAAETGNTTAMNNLGALFKNEKNDFENAMLWYLKAAENGDVDSMFSLGGLFHNEKNNLNKAVEWYLKAVERGNIGAMNNLGVLFQNEKKDHKKAMEWYLRAAEKGNAQSMYNLGWLFENETNDHEKAMEWYLKAAESGNAPAMNNLGVLFEKTKNNPEKAMEWYLKAAESGNAPAMNNLGVLFEKTKNDPEKALDWYLKAAESGNAPAMNNLGTLFENTKNDIEKAMEWYIKATEKGNIKAAQNLGLLFYSKKKDVKKSIEWVSKAAKASDYYGMATLVWIYFEQKMEKTEALKWTRIMIERSGSNSGLQHTAACALAWNNELSASKQLAQEFIQDETLLTDDSDACTIYFTLMLAKNEAQWLYELFTGESGEKVQLKDRFKPIWYAILKQLDHPDFLRMGDELAETVEEILAKAKEMTVAYA